MHKKYSYLRCQRYLILSMVACSLLLLALGCYDLNKSDFASPIGDITTMSWVVQASGPGADKSNGIDVFPGGDIVVAGQIGGGEVDFDLENDGEENLVQADGIYDIFLARYSPTGALQWVKKAGGDSNDSAVGVSVSEQDSVLITGYTGGSTYATSTFGEGEENETELVNNGAYSASYSNSGLLNWVKIPASDWGFQFGKAVDAPGSGASDLIHFTGEFNGDAIFAPGESGEITLSAPSGHANMFLAAYRENGELAFAVQSENGRAVGNGLSSLVDGSAIVVGTFEDTAIFGSGESGEIDLTTDGGEDVFIARFDDDGSLIWAKQAGGSLNDSGFSIAETSEGEVLVSGTFMGSAIFGPGESEETTLLSAGETDVFFAKYALNDGKLIWAKSMGGPGSDGVGGIDAFSDGSFVLVGNFQGNVVLVESDGNHGETTMESAGGMDAYILILDAVGNLVSRRSVGGPGEDFARAVVASADNSVVVTGDFDGTVMFGEDEETELSSDSSDIFVMRLEF